MREGQTMSTNVQLRKIQEITTVVTDMAQFLDNYGKELTFARHDFLSSVVMRRMQGVLRKYLLEMDDNSFITSDFSSTLETFTRYAPIPLTVPINGVLKFDILPRWRNKGRRYKTIVRKAMLATDSAMQWIYKQIFG